MSKILECVGLSKRFGSFTALDNINFSLETGRIVGLLGPNGSGKTTLLKLACDLLVPTEGHILVNGIRPSVETKEIVSFLPDRMYFDNWMKVKDCINIFADFYKDFNVPKVYDMLASLNIDPNLMFRTLSKGTKEKVQLSLVMCRNAKLYLLDEPIGGVDPAARDYILNTIIKNYNEEGTVVISTHLIQDIERVLDDVIFLNNGRVMRVSSVDEIREIDGKSVDEKFREEFRC